MADGRHGCCCGEFSCEEWLNCPIYEPWCFTASALHRIEYYQNNILTSYREEWFEIHNAVMVWDPIYNFYVCIAGEVSYRCEEKSKSYPCGNYWSPQRPCEGCEPQWCSRTTTSADHVDLADAGTTSLQCYDPCNSPDPPCGFPAFPTSTLFIDLYNLPVNVEYEKITDAACCQPGIPVGIDGPYPTYTAFQGKFFGKPGCFRPAPIGGIEETFDEWSYEPWTMCDYYNPTPLFAGGIATGYITANIFPTYPNNATPATGTICDGGYVFAYECFGTGGCPLKTVYNLMKPFEWEAESCLQGLINPYGGVCWTAPIPQGTVVYDCYANQPMTVQPPWHDGGAKIKHSLTTSIQTRLLPCP